jgi:S1-C subfamily serine protease
LKLDSVPVGTSEVRFAAAASRPNDVVYFIGNPQVKNILWDCAIGTTNAIDIKEWEFATGQAVRAEVVEVETAAGLDSGFSGGPVLNGSGELVGLTVAAREEKSSRIYCASASEVRKRLAQSYSTLAMAALRAGDFTAFRELIATGRKLSPGDSALVCLAWLDRFASPSAPAFRCVGWIVRPSNQGTPP